MSFLFFSLYHAHLQFRFSGLLNSSFLHRRWKNFEKRSIFLLLFCLNRLNNSNDFVQSHRSFVQVFFLYNMQEVIFEQVGVKLKFRGMEDALFETKLENFSKKRCFMMARIIFARESFKNRTNVSLMWKDNVTQLFDTPALPQLPFLIEAI